MQLTNKQINQQIPNKDIHKRIYQFVLRVINLTKATKSTPENEVITKQLIRSVTSMGANDQEADASESRKDFIAKYTIVKKESKETNYWLKLFGDINPEFKKRMIDLEKEGLEILRIISAIIISAKRKT